MDGNRETFSVSELDAAATKLQKVYKGYRTRRNLADAAVVVEELWWKAMDFAALKQSSISFFNSEENETAVSRWARSRTRAAKIGKGLCKDEKTQILAPQYWLEAAMWPDNDHHLPTVDNFKEFISFLKDHKVDLTNVKIIAMTPLVQLIISVRVWGPMQPMEKCHLYLTCLNICLQVEEESYIGPSH